MTLSGIFICLPALINADNAAAAFKDGVLGLTLPKAEGAKPKAIKVTAY